MFQETVVFFFCVQIKMYGGKGKKKLFKGETNDWIPRTGISVRVKPLVTLLNTRENYPRKVGFKRFAA